MNNGNIKDLEKGKQCEVCRKSFPSLDKHHIQSQCYGGVNKQYNIANICPNCHRLVHRKKVILEGRFASTGGNILLWRTYNKESISGIKDPQVFTYNSNKEYEKRKLNEISKESINEDI